MTTRIDQRTFNLMAEAHKLWLQDRKRGRQLDVSYCDLTGLDLSDQNLREAKMEGTILFRVNLKRTNLSMSYMKNADLTGAFMFRTVMRGAILDYAIFKGAAAKHSDFSYSTMNHCDFSHAIFGKNTLNGIRVRTATFYNADLSRNHFIKSCFENCDLRKANLEWSVLHKVVIKNCDLRGANLDATDFQAAKLITSNFRGASMVESCFERAELYKVAMDEPVNTWPISSNDNVIHYMTLSMTNLFLSPKKKRKSATKKGSEKKKNPIKA